MKNPRARVKKHSGSDKVPGFRKALLAWYDENRRDLPWRYDPGEAADPYAVWLSEIMLQQTTVAAVIPYFLKFVSKWPDVFALAAADIDEVMREWAGLGYYARARNLHKCAQVVAYERGGVFPEDQKELMILPGIGEYTSAAIRAIAFGKPATVVDGNVERVMARVHGLQGHRQEVKKQAKDHARAYFEGYEERPGDLAQAFMDLGSTVCIPKAPRCSECPLSLVCLSYQNNGELLNSIGAKRPFKKPIRKGYVYFVRNGSFDILLERRPETGLLGGMNGLPTSLWSAEYQNAYPPAYLNNCVQTLTDLTYHHHFTHFFLELRVVFVSASSEFFPDSNTFWITADRLLESGLPSVFKKAALLYINSKMSSDLLKLWK